MEDSFSVRVEKAFGSLPVPGTTTAVPSADALSHSLWCLTDEEIERKEWNRDKGESKDDAPKPHPSNLDGFAKQATGSDLKKSDLIKELEDDLAEDEEEDDVDDENEKVSSSRKLEKPDDYDDEAWSIASSIGQDCTLDKEEEEDHYDRVATGRAEDVDSLYLRDITDYDADINPYHELPYTFKEVDKDPRADHTAAKLRLVEDAEAANNFNHLQDLNSNRSAQEPKTVISKDCISLNSILKNKESRADSKSKKRVRFDPNCKDDSAEKSEGTNVLAPLDSSGVPDYVRNPSKYKHYTFDSSTDVDEASNRGAYTDFLKLLKGPNNRDSQDNISFELPMSVTFTPRKKLGDNTSVVYRIEPKKNQKDNIPESVHKKGFPIGIADEDEQGSGLCAMEEDEPAVGDGISSSRKPGRQYRTKFNADFDDIVT